MQLNIDGREYVIEANPEMTILEACQSVGISIPSLCYAKNLGILATCRVCVVELEGARSLITACSAPVTQGMVIRTNSPRVLEARKVVLELLLSDHQLDCLKCPRNFDCRLREAAGDSGCDARRFKRNLEYKEINNEGDHVMRNVNKCILCTRCVKVCAMHQEVGVLSVVRRGFQSGLGTAWDKNLSSVPCIACGQCIVNCPVAALEENNMTTKPDTKKIDNNILVIENGGNKVDKIELLKQMLNDKSKHVVVATAPATRVGIGEGFGLEAGTNWSGKMVASLRRLGFDRVFDLNVAADICIMEEGTEFLERLRNDSFLPMFTSCCPSWIAYATMMHPDLIPNISTTKSPMMIFGALIKSYYAKQVNMNPEDIFLVMLMPCLSKAKEAETGNPCKVEPLDKKDIDLVLTLRQLVQMLREYKIDFVALEDEDFDNPFGVASGAGIIFGTTGGVMEAAVRTVAEVYLDKRVEAIDYKVVRGEQGIKVATLDSIEDNQGNPLKIAVVSGIKNAEKVIQDIKGGKEKYHFIEIMSCPHGCVNGGGMPVHGGNIQDNFENARKRASALYTLDERSTIRRSHDNPIVQKIYKEFLGKPGSKLAHELFHTCYTPKKKYK